MDVKIVTTVGCPICMLTHQKLSKSGVQFEEVKFATPEGKEMAKKSPEKHFPMLIVDGEYFCGDKALQKAGSLSK